MRGFQCPQGHYIIPTVDGEQLFYLDGCAPCYQAASEFLAVRASRVETPADAYDAAVLDLFAALAKVIEAEVG